MNPTLEFLGKSAEKGSRILRDHIRRLRGEEAKQFDTTTTSFAILLRKALDDYEVNEDDPDRKLKILNMVANTLSLPATFFPSRKASYDNIGIVKMKDLNEPNVQYHLFIQIMNNNQQKPNKKR
jgi:hypothetical protein